MPRANNQNRLGYCPAIPHAQIHAQRNAYRYPAVALLGPVGSHTHVGFGSTRALDSHFNGLLRSAEHNDKLLAYLGIIYWGHFSGSTGRTTPQRALGKVNLAYYGQDRVHRGRAQHMQGVVDLALPEVARSIDDAAALIAANQYGDAARRLTDLPGIQFAFATKICAFLDPEKCGVADSLIAGKYPGFGFASNGQGYITNTVGNSAQYDQYCVCLQDMARVLNAAPAPYSNWTDRDGALQRWRAIDAERALY